MGCAEQLQLVAVTENGRSSMPMSDLPEIAGEVLRSTAALYARVGFRPPWIGYLAVEGGTCVGTCGFKSPPQAGEVEIAYFTFPDNEGRGVATRMATLLIELARQHDPSLTVTAQTLPQVNASNTILRKLGFKHCGELEHREDGVVWKWDLPSSAAH